MAPGSAGSAEITLGALWAQVLAGLTDLLPTKGGACPVYLFSFFFFSSWCCSSSSSSAAFACWPAPIERHLVHSRRIKSGHIRHFSGCISPKPDYHHSLLVKWALFWFPRLHRLRLPSAAPSSSLGSSTLSAPFGAPRLPVREVRRTSDFVL